jgi:hypothetical protein
MSHTSELLEVCRTVDQFLGDIFESKVPATSADDLRDLLQQARTVLARVKQQETPINKYHLGQHLKSHGLRDDNEFNNLVGEVISIVRHPTENTLFYTLRINQGIVNLGAELEFREENLRPV